MDAAYWNQSLIMLLFGLCDHFESITPIHKKRLQLKLSFPFYYQVSCPKVIIFNEKPL